MGRASRKSTGTAEVSSGRSKWTETHPDRELWTPHQRALAESMSQEAYEAAYGRGGPTESVEVAFVRSGFLPTVSVADISKIAEGKMERHEISRLLEVDEFFATECTPDDALVQALWQSEWNQTIDSLRDMGAEETLELFQGKESEIQAIWMQIFASRIDEAAYVDAYPDVPFSLYEMALSGQLVRHLDLGPDEEAKLRGEVTRQMAEWSEHEPEQFRSFAQRTLLPALSDSTSRFGILDSSEAASIRRISEKFLEALYGEKYATEALQTIHNLGARGFFDGAVSEEGLYQNFLESLADKHFLRQVGKSQSQPWGPPPSSAAHEGALYSVVYAGTGYLRLNGGLRKKFTQSPLGQRVAEELSLEDPYKDIENIARGFSEHIFDLLLRGEISAIKAWKMAQDNVVRPGYI